MNLKNVFKQLFFSQQGAMFGMDARIALIIASVLAATGGIAMLSRLESSRVDKAELSIDQLRAAISTYYQTISLSYLPETLEDLFAEGLVEDPSAKTDPWNGDWFYSIYTENITLEGLPVDVHYATIHSAGKDGVNDSDTLAAEGDYAAWKPLNDDVGIKFSTRDIEMMRLDEYRAQGQMIVDKIENKESSSYLQAQGSCDGASVADWCNSADGKNYTQFNFYPKSDLDQTEGVIYFEEASESHPAYVAGDINDMEELMVDIGLPTSYAKDPWGKILFYHSNTTGRENPPFTASICFSSGGECS